MIMKVRPPKTSEVFKTPEVFHPPESVRSGTKMTFPQQTNVMS
ncbi:Uncharacterized protein dnm_024070 [Desulfonema magnum]|uniref:Uncharacterized protein n=1 Tax=Desulfonema magnum TaxID=45655 RepID=A0A975GN06_9BACT|nr:Uncharacterized protein dnm_024070 [Desulfonema magnum]